MMRRGPLTALPVLLVLASGAAWPWPAEAHPGTTAPDSSLRLAALSTRPAAAPPRTAQTAAQPRPATPSRVFLTCVPYARMATGIDLRGNARDWWANAAGRYHRSQTPEVGAVLAFPASGGMRSGHVAVVEQVLGPRHILIHHANWEGPGIRKGSITRGISVVDVSPDNSWTRVRVQTGLSPGVYGREYPTHGFIHNRPAGEPILTARRAAPVELALAPEVSPHLARHLSVSAELLAAD
jgi:hypothetical protein